jgi:hypothetical protein
VKIPDWNVVNFLNGILEAYVPRNEIFASALLFCTTKGTSNGEADDEAVVVAIVAGVEVAAGGGAGAVVGRTPVRLHCGLSSID